MSALMGKDGSFALAGGIVGYIDAWALKATIGAAEITQYGDPARNYANTIKEWSGTLSGTLSRADANQLTLLNQAEGAVLAGTTVKLCTTTSLSTYWGGTAWIKGYNAGSDVTNKVSV